MNEQPILSIGIPNYNYAKYLKQCLDSVVLNIPKNIEIIISDNYSKDNSWEIIKKYEKENVRVYRQQKNIGLYANWDFLLKQAKGKYFKILQADDWLEESFYSSFIRVLDEGIEPDLLVWGYNTYKDNKLLFEVLPSTVGIENKSSLVDVNWSFVRKLIRFSQPDFSAYKKEIALLEGGFDLKDEMRTDLFLFTKIVLSKWSKVLGVIDSKIVAQRVHSQNDRRKYNALKIYRSEFIWVKILESKIGQSEKGNIHKQKNIICAKIIYGALFQLFKFQRREAIELFGLLKNDKLIMRSVFLFIIYFPIILIMKLRIFQRSNYIKRIHEYFYF